MTLLGIFPSNAQPEIVLVSQVGIVSDNQLNWCMPHRGLDREQMQQAFDHLRKHSISNPSTDTSAYALNPWGEFETQFDLVDALSPGFGEATTVVGSHHRLSNPPSLKNTPTYQEASLRPQRASLAGFKFIESLSYSPKGGLAKQVHRVFPMESTSSKSSNDDAQSLTSAMGFCDCRPSDRKRIRNGKIAFQEDVVVDVPFLAPAEDPEDLATLNLLRALFADVGEGKRTALDYNPPGGQVPTAKEREKSPFTVNVYNEFGEVVGSRDTVFVTPRIGDEFGGALTQEQLREKLHFQHDVRVYDEWGDFVGVELQKQAIASWHIRGLRLYETWSFVNNEPCPRKRVNYVVPLSGRWNEDGIYVGLVPLGFAVVMSE